MPTNKNASARYRILDRCFRNTGRRFYIQDLIAACSEALEEMGLKGVSRRTILNDIDYMESDAGWGRKGIDILRIKDEDGKRVYYRYADPKFSIDSTPLSIEDLLQLRVGIESLAQFKGHPLFENMSDILNKLDNLATADVASVMEFESNPYLAGIEHTDCLYQAIRNKQVLEVVYQSFNWDTEQHIIFHPYYLKQYNNRWFVFGHNAEYPDMVWNMAVDRILQIDIMPNIPYIECDIDWSEYFSDIMGVSNPPNAEVETIVLRCYGNSGRYIENKPIHESQRQRWIDKNCMEVKLTLKPNFELENYILGQGENIEVIKPLHLREKIRNRISAAHNLYIVGHSV